MLNSTEKFAKELADGILNTKRRGFGEGTKAIDEGGLQLTQALLAMIILILLKKG